MGWLEEDWLHACPASLCSVGCPVAQLTIAAPVVPHQGSGLLKSPLFKSSEICLNYEKDEIKRQLFKCVKGIKSSVERWSM